jgi:DNA-binding MarR family transcriptional regulator
MAQDGRRAGARPTSGSAPGILSRLGASCLSYLAAHPGASGVAVRDALGMRHLSQTSRLLARLESQGLVRNHRPGGPANAWELTAAGCSALDRTYPIRAAYDATPLSTLPAL